MASNYWRAKMILESHKKRWLKVNPNLNENSGIYMLTRVDENGFKYAYIGQAKHILTRLAQHSMQYEHIDLSLKKHKLFDYDTNPHGWKVNFWECAESEMDEYERRFIKDYADKGYQLRNKTAGGQDKGKVGINDEQSNRGYRDGLKQGYKNAIKEIKEYFDKYLDYITKHSKDCFKKDGTLKEIYKKKFDEFTALLEGDDNE